MKLLKKIALFVSLLSLSFYAQGQVKKDIVDIASDSKMHTTLVAGIKAADLVTTLKGKGPFTVFAPTNNAFAKLPDGTLDKLLMPENKSKLSDILTYHVVAGRLTAKTILGAIKKGGGTSVLTTVQGGKLTAAVVKGTVILTDEKGNEAKVTATDLKATNGTIHVIDTVLMSN